MSNRHTVDRLVAIRDDASSFFGSRSAMQRVESAKMFNREILQEKSIPAGSYGISYPRSRLVSRN
jgi:phosphoribosylamine-glycine ligase